MVNPGGSPESTRKAAKLPPPKSPATPSTGMAALSPNFTPGDHDVICARGKAAKDHAGNVWFRALVQENLQEYSECESKLDKSFVVSKVLKRVRKESPHGGFVKKVKGAFWEVGDRLSREKIGQTFRDMLHTKYSSSTKAKAVVRKQRASGADDGGSANDTTTGVVKAASLPAAEKDTQGQQKQSITRKLLDENDNTSPRKKAKTTPATLPEESNATGTTQPKSLALAPESMANASLSNLNTMSMGSFPILPNLNRNQSIGDPFLPSGASATYYNSNNAATNYYRGSNLLNPAVMQNERQLEQQFQQQQQFQMQMMRQQQFAASRNTASMMSHMGGEMPVEPMPFNEPLDNSNSAAALPTASFGEAIDEMFQAQLFSSDTTLEEGSNNNSSGSMPKLPPSN